MRKYKILVLMVATLLGVGCGGAKFPYRQLVRSTPISGDHVIADVRIFDGVSPTLSDLMDVRIRDGRIVSITEATGNPQADKITPGMGKVLMPGLIDTHVHLNGSGSVPWAQVKAHVPYNLEAYLYAGVTTVYELGGFAPQSKKLRRKVEAGKLPGPSIYYTHMPITVEGSHPIPLGSAISPFPLNKLGPKLIPTVETAADAVKYAAKYKKMGVDYLKVICDKIPPTAPEMDAALVKALVDAGHAEGMKVIVHVGSASNALAAVRAKADVLAHGIWRSPLTEAEAKEIAASGIPIIYTLAGFENVQAVYVGEFQPTEYDRILVPGAVLDPVSGAAGTRIDSTPVMGEFAQCVHDQHGHWKENFALLYRAGAKILVGTDSALPGTWPGATFHQEMALLKEYGMRNLEILKGATSDAAKMFLSEPDFGRVAVGMRADLLLLEGNPLENLEVLKHPKMVLARGREIVRVR